MTNVNLHIERLILDGIEIPSHQHPDLQTAMETELARLLDEGGLQAGLEAGGAVREVSGGMIEAAEGYNPAAFGPQIAHAVYRGIGR